MRLRELALLFLKLGVTAFGGPAAHVAMMEDEVVRRRAWMTQEEFLDLYGATNLIPGPNSTEMAIHIGHHRAGFAGLAVAGSFFILPAAMITLGFAYAYKRYGALPEAGWLLYGIKPVIIAVVMQALVRLGRSALKTRLLAALALLCAVLVFLGVNELAVLFGAGLFIVLARRARPSPRSPSSSSAAGFMFASTASAAGVSAAAAAPFGLSPLFLFFAKVGAVLFGSGYVLLAFLRADLVDRLRWMTEAQLLDAIAVGQVTPGPVFTTATFIGYLLGGVSGAGVATLGIFLPAFFFVAISGPLVPRLRQSPAAGAFLDGVNVASLALMVAVSVKLAQTAVVDWVTGGLAVVSALVLLRFRLNATWLILGGGLAGLAAHLVR